jgi:hypothetical protein
MSDLSLTAASNSPAGTDAIGNSLDDFLRAHAAIMRSTYALASSAIASASSIDVAAADAESVSITGTTTITSLGTGYAGCVRELRFAGALTLTDSATLYLGGADFTTQAGDVLRFRCTAAGTWTLVGGSRVGLASPSITGTATYNGIEIGFRGIPITLQNGSYTLTAADAGKGLMHSDASARTYTVPSGTFSAGDVVTVINQDTANVTLA